MTQPTPGPAWKQAVSALEQAPDLAGSPSLSTSVLTTDPATAGGVAQTLGAVQQQQAGQEAGQHAHDHGWWGDVTSVLGHVRTGVWDHIPGHTIADKVVTGPLATVANWANKPLAQAQHEYRYVRDVWERHGVDAGLTALTGIATGAAFGGYVGFAGGPMGALAGADLGAIATGMLEGEVFHHDSWVRSGQPGYLLNGQPVSPGRDIAGLVGLPHKGLAFHAVSGLVDASFDAAADPTLKVGGAVGKAQEGRYALTAADDFAPMVAQALDRGPLTDPLARAVHDIARTDSATTITNRYPTLRTLPAETRTALAQATTPEGVASVLNDAVVSEGFQGTRGVPLLSLTRVPLRKLGDEIKNWQLDRGEVDGLVQAASDPSKLAQAASAVAYRVNSFANHTPFTINPDTLKITTEDFHPMDPRAATAAYAMARYGNSERVARSIADGITQAQADGDVQRVAQLWTNAAQAAIVGRGLPADAKTLGDLGANMDGIRQVSGLHDDSTYGHDPGGTDVSKVTMPDGSRLSVPIFTSQAGMLHPLSLQDLNRAARDNGWGSRLRIARAWGKMYGPLDDGIYTYLMSPLYRAMLLTGGFALRNSLTGEMLPRIIGSDGAELLRRAASKSVEKAYYNYANPSSNMLVRAAQAALHGAAWSLDKTHLSRLVTDSDFRDFVFDRLQEDGNGGVLPAAAQAGHTTNYYAGNLGDTITQDLRSRVAVHGARLNPNRWVTYMHSDGIKPLARALSGHLSTIGRDQGARIQAQAYLDALPADLEHITIAQERQAFEAGARAGYDWLANTSPGELAQKMIRRSNLTSNPDVEDPLRDWAAVRMKAIQGATTSPHGTINRDLLQGIAGFEDPAMRVALHPDRIAEHGLDKLPGSVPGMELTPDLSHLASRVAAFGFDKVLSPTINRLSREPIWLSHAYEEYKLAKTIPGLTEDEALHMAKVRATNRMIPEIHNPMDRAQFSIAARNYIPFWFAKEQSYRRIARALHENPLGWRKIQLAVHGMKDTGFMQQDPTTGQTYFTYPLSGEIGRFVPQALSKMGVDTTVGVPTTMRGTLQGFWPGGENPGAAAQVGWSPLVNASLKGLAAAFPDLAGISTALQGPAAASQDFMSTFIPNSVARDLVQLYQGDSSRQFLGSMLDTIQAAYANGDTPPANATQDSPAWNAWLSRIRTHTRIGFALRLLYGVGAPSSPILTIGNKVLSDEFNADVTARGLSAGTQAFLQRHPNATSYTVFKSGGVGGVDIPSTKVAFDWAQSHRDFINKWGAAATFFLPQPGKSDPSSLSAYADEIQSGLRQVKSADEFTKEIAVQQGWNLWTAAHTLEQQAIASRPNDAQQIKANFAGYVTNVLGVNQPIWYQDYLNADNRKASKQQIIGQLQQIFASGQAPDSPQTPLLAQMLSSYATYQQQLAAAADPTSAAYNYYGKYDIPAQWNSYVEHVAGQYPQLATAINRLFKGA